MNNYKKGESYDEKHKEDKYYDEEHGEEKCHLERHESKEYQTADENSKVNPMMKHHVEKTRYSAEESEEKHDEERYESKEHDKNIRKTTPETGINEDEVQCCTTRITRMNGMSQFLKGK